MHGGMNAAFYFSKFSSHIQKLFEEILLRHLLKIYVGIAAEDSLCYHSQIAVFSLQNHNKYKMIWRHERWFKERKEPVSRILCINTATDSVHILN